MKLVLFALLLLFSVKSHASSCLFGELESASAASLAEIAHDCRVMGDPHSLELSYFADYRACRDFLVVESCLDLATQPFANRSRKWQERAMRLLARICHPEEQPEICSAYATALEADVRDGEALQLRLRACDAGAAEECMDTARLLLEWSNQEDAYLMAWRACDLDGAQCATAASWFPDRALNFQPR